MILEDDDNAICQNYIPVKIEEETTQATHIEKVENDAHLVGLNHSGRWYVMNVFSFYYVVIVNIYVIINVLFHFYWNSVFYW